MSVRMRMPAVLLTASWIGGAFASSVGTHIVVPTNTVIPIKFEDELSVKENRAGDRFMVSVVNDKDLPAGTRLEGRVIDLKPKTKDHPAFMDLEFVRVLLPDGTRARIRAVPIPMDKNVTRRPDGRYQATKKVIRKEDYVLGGAVGGLVFGTLLKKPFEGTFIGTLAGIIAAETNGGDSDLMIKRGQEMGAFVERDFATDSSADYGHYYDRSDPHWDAEFGTPKIAFRDSDLRYSAEETPYRLGDTVMVPLLRTAEQMDLDVENVSEKVVLLESDDSMLRLEQDSDNYRLNGRRGVLPRPVVNKKGVLYVPIGAFAMMRIGRLTVNGTTIEGSA